MGLTDFLSTAVAQYKDPRIWIQLVLKIRFTPVMHHSSGHSHWGLTNQDEPLYLLNHPPTTGLRPPQYPAAPSTRTAQPMDQKT